MNLEITPPDHAYLPGCTRKRSAGHLFFPSYHLPVNYMPGSRPDSRCDVATKKGYKNNSQRIFACVAASEDGIMNLLKIHMGIFGCGRLPVGAGGRFLFKIHNNFGDRPIVIICVAFCGECRKVVSLIFANHEFFGVRF